MHHATTEHDQRGAGRSRTPRWGATRAKIATVETALASLSTDDHDHPHSLKPHTWHFMHPSANSSCDPQSGQAPDSVSCSPPSTICSPLGPVAGWATIGAGAVDAALPGSSSC